MPRKIVFQDEKTQNIFDNLLNQIDRIKHRNNEKGFSTQARYYASAKRFCKFLAEDFRSKKFANVSTKHLKAYVEKLQTEGKSAQYMDTELSGIRFYHERSGSKNRLPENKALNLEKRHPKQFDRSFMKEEIKDAYNCAVAMGRSDVKAGMRLCYRFGLRFEEAVTIRVRQYYTELLADYQDVLTTSDIVKLTGYVKTTVNGWCGRRQVKYFSKSNIYYMPKVFLVDFFCSPAFRSITRKSAWHIKTLSDFQRMLKQEKISAAKGGKR